MSRIALGRLESRLECPFCGKELPDMQAACCGERGHAVEVSDEEAEQVLQHMAAQAAIEELAMDQ